MRHAVSQKNTKGTFVTLSSKFRMLLCSVLGKQTCPLKGGCLSSFDLTTQVKKLQVMLRQANDQLERTMKDKQELEDYMKQSTEDSATQVQKASL